MWGVQLGIGKGLREGGGRGALRSRVVCLLCLVFFLAKGSLNSLPFLYCWRALYSNHNIYFLFFYKAPFSNPR